MKLLPLALAGIIGLGFMIAAIPPALADGCTGTGAGNADSCVSGTIYSEPAASIPCGGSTLCIGMEGDTRKMFFAQSLFWSFHQDNIHSPMSPSDAGYVWDFSTDGVTWTRGDAGGAGTGMRDSTAGFIRGHTFAVDSDGTFVYVVHGSVSTNSGTQAVEFRRGLLNPTGTISFDPIQTIQVAGVDSCWNQMAIMADRNSGTAKRILVVGMKTVNCANAAFVIESAYSSSSDGTGAWTKGDLENACPSGNCNTQAYIAQLAGANFLVLYADTGAADGSKILFSRTVNAGVTGARVTVDSVGVFSSATFNIVGDSNGNAYLAYVQGVVGGNHVLAYRSYTGGVWSLGLTLLTPSDCSPSPGTCAANMGLSITADFNPNGGGSTPGTFRLYVEVAGNANMNLLSRRGGIWDAAFTLVTTCVNRCDLYGSMAASNSANRFVWAYATDLATSPHNVRSEILTEGGLVLPKPLDAQVNSAILLFLFASWLALILYIGVWIHGRRSD